MASSFLMRPRTAQRGPHDPVHSLTGNDGAADVREQSLVGRVRADDALHGVVDAELDGAVRGLPQHSRGDPVKERRQVSVSCPGHRRAELITQTRE